MRKARRWLTGRRFSSRAALGAVLLAVVPFAAAGTASATSTTAAASSDLDPNAPPSSRPAAGPERAALAANSRPTSGKNPSAGPQFKKSGSTWRVIAPEVVLQNTATDPDGDKVDVTFEVWTADADGKPKDRVKLTDTNPYGVLVSPYVASGKPAQAQVDYGRLKPGVTYVFHTNAYDGGLYETEWSPWATFRIEPYMSFPAPQASSTIDQTTQTPETFTRTDPGPALPTLRADGSIAKQPAKKRSCGAPDAQGHRLCIELSPPSKKQSLTPRRPGIAAAVPKAELIPWCEDKQSGADYMTRSDACLKSIGSGKLIFTDTDPEKPALGYANFEFEQRVKAYPTKTESGSDFAEFDQQILIKPTYIDPQLEDVKMDWKVASSCDDECIQTPPKWTDDNGTDTGGSAYWVTQTTSQYDRRWGTALTKWVGSGKKQIDLGWDVTATVGAGGNPATANFGTSGDTRVRELAPRCDTLVAGAKPGCTLTYFHPTLTVDTNLYPAAGAYYWLMQERLPDHAGARRWDSLLHYLGPDTTVKNSNGDPWTTDDSRKVVCPTSWKKHTADSSVGATDCDEYAMASTHESGGFPDGVNQVSRGDQCAQYFTDRMTNGNTEFGLFADTRTATRGPSGKERCGRAAINSTQNEKAFSKLPVAKWRLLDNDGYFVNLPGYAHCQGADKTCTWKKTG
ncbi:hypothetical protein [Streptomyces olivochromogenes]|uniref:hypothetical protein n=1 Tax=Streptomyces olivochromogenes TaxID=1963 RepID=UPI001F388E65|nr:hypothetical protein [Streptomyces olivochromogenes]MCF3132410.1 hypothetical protein [Streptomyces olivochromogenes]